MNDTSYNEAEEYVKEKLGKGFLCNREDRCCIEVPGMNECDCIPISIEWDNILAVGTWHLTGVVSSGPRRLDATYEFVEKR